MESSSAKLLVLVGKQFACVKIAGRANFNSSIDFQTLVTELQAKGISCFVIDLSECVLMDSTFLGVLAGFGLRMRENSDVAATGSVTFLNPSSRVTELLENLGVLELFRITHGKLAAPEALEPCPSGPAHASREELTRACLEAHETLMAINPENVARFKDVAKFLAEDLAKLRK
jgi:anti-anti-sigma regulatory factor